MQPTITIPLADYEALIADNKQLNEKLTQVLFQLAEFQRMIFGTKSERFTSTVPLPSAPTLFDIPGSGVLLEPLTTKQITVTVPVKKKNEGHPGRKPLPAHLTREVTILEPSESTEGMTVIGQDITEVLDYTPGKLIVRQFIRPKYARAKGSGIVTAELPEMPITRGMAGSGLLTQLIISKFIDSQPIYRQIEIFKREGIELSPATVAGWIEGTATLLEPLYNLLVKLVLAAYYLQVDETRLQVLDRKEKGKSTRGWIWAYHAPLLRLVMFDYAEGRGKENPAHHLKHFKGFLQTDGYAVYDGFGMLPGVTLASCWAHSRREIFESKDYDLPRAEYVLKEIGRLYELERMIKTLSAAERYAQRQEISVPILNNLHIWMQQAFTEVLPQSPIGKALAYSLKRWNRLMTYTTAGELEIDSNLVENAIRPIAMGRKNYLFAGSHESAKRMAMLYSLLGSCKKNGIEPFSWLKKTIELLPSWPANRLNELLPNYKTQEN